MFQLLALKMGFDKGPDGDPCFRETVDQMIDGALHTDNQWFKGITRERLEVEPQVRMNFAQGTDADSDNNDAHSAPFRPFADGKFYTASGTAELYSENVKAMGLDPVARFVPPV